MNPFEVLGFAPSFSLDPKELSARQRELSRTLHPDKFVGRPSAERRAALGKAIEVNEAHRALQNPLTRAEALLAHLGLTLPEGGAPPVSPDILMETMERREELRDAGRGKDEDKVNQLVSLVAGEESRLLSTLNEAFSTAQSEGAALDSPVATRIHSTLGHLRYLRRFLDEANAILDELI